jgi:hypothetical protein
MPSIRSAELPPEALLRKYLTGGGYADCYVTEVPQRVSHAEYVEAFYTTALFKIERLLLAWLVARPATDAQAAALANGTLDRIAAWGVEGRSADQLLLADFQGRTRSWLMVAPGASQDGNSTRLYFGSAVVPRVGRSGRREMGSVFRLLLGFHQLYSRALLRAATARLARLRRTATT